MGGNPARAEEVGGVAKRMMADARCGWRHCARYCATNAVNARKKTSTNSNIKKEKKMRMRREMFELGLEPEPTRPQGQTSEPPRARRFPSLFEA